MIERKDIINYRLVDGKVVIGITNTLEEKIIIKDSNNEWWKDYQYWLLTHTPLPANPLPNPVIITEDWDSLAKTLTEHPLFYKVYGASKLSVETNAIFTVLQSTITITKNPITLKTVLTELVKLVIMTTENKLFINKLLKDNKFDFTV